MRKRTSQLEALLGIPWPVLDKGHIMLVDVMGDDLSIVEAARASHVAGLKGAAQDKKLLHYLWTHNHTTPFEMVEFKFEVRAPVLVWWQWVRHRTASYNAQSGRYTPFKEDDFYVPEENQWRLQSATNHQGSDGTLAPHEGGEELTTQMIDHFAESFRLYQNALTMGVAKEQARLFLPGWSLYYTWIVKQDLHNLLHFIRLRLDDHAQYEIRVYAEAILNLIEPFVPWTIEFFKEQQQ